MYVVCTWPVGLTKPVQSKRQTNEDILLNLHIEPTSKAEKFSDIPEQDTCVPILESREIQIYTYVGTYVQQLNFS